MAGVVSPSGLHVVLCGVDIVAKQTWVVTGLCVEVVGGIVGVVVVTMLLAEDMPQACDFGITFNMHVKLWDVVWLYFKQVLLATRHPNITVNPSRVFHAKNDHIYA